jgi:hypothetical protein
MLGGLICRLMLVWEKGNAAVQKQVDEMQIPISDIAEQIASGNIPRSSAPTSRTCVPSSRLRQRCLTS